jgi:hypothetical protein
LATLDDKNNNNLLIQISSHLVQTKTEMEEKPHNLPLFFKCGGVDIKGCTFMPLSVSTL